MSTLYISEQGAIVQRRSGQLLVTKARKTVQNFPETQVRRLVLFGNVNLTTPVVAFCLENEIEVVFLSSAGQFRGRLSGDWKISANIRRMQFEKLLSPKFALSVARNIVGGKINNQSAFIRRLAVGNKTEAGIKLLSNLKAQTLKTMSTESLLGVEGAASAAYFKLLRSAIPEPFRFENRSANPPRDEVNALLSLSYTLIYNRIVSQLNLAGLDPYQGFLHQVRSGHAALASDIVEEFRTPIADSLVLRLLRRRQLSQDHFVRDSQKCLLNDAGRRIFFTEFERKMSSKRQFLPAGGNHLSFSNIIGWQVSHMARVITGKDNEYRPFELK
jgi:CRISPR-associated protein Cas1